MHTASDKHPFECIDQHALVLLQPYWDPTVTVAVSISCADSGERYAVHPLSPLSPLAAPSPCPGVPGAMLSPSA